MTTNDSSLQLFSKRRGILRRLFTRAAEDASGAVAIEFGILVPLLAFVVVSTLDIGFAIYRKMQVEDAAQAGAEYSIRNGFDPAAISAAVTAATNNPAITATPAPVQFCGCATGTSISTATCGTRCPDGTQAGTYATVSAQTMYNTTLNYSVVPSNYTFSAQATARLQ